MVGIPFEIMQNNNPFKARRKLIERDSQEHPVYHLPCGVRLVGQFNLADGFSIGLSEFIEGHHLIRFLS